jgi:hypothetical protein
MRPHTRGWIVDACVGGLIGGVLGAIVAVNVVIFSGIERGYESGITEIFEYSTLLGVLVSAILVTGPILGVILARRARAIRGRRTT